MRSRKGISENGKSVTDERVCLIEVSINGIRATERFSRSWSCACHKIATSDGRCAQKEAQRKGGGPEAAYSAERESTENGYPKSKRLLKKGGRKSREKQKLQQREIAVKARNSSAR